MALDSVCMVLLLQLVWSGHTKPQELVRVDTLEIQSPCMWDLKETECR
jgi:hypothetical protein